MTVTPEGKVKARVKKVLKEFEAYQHWPVQAGYGKPCLDCHGCYNGLYYAVETKAPGKNLTPRQTQTVEEIVDAGGKVFIIGRYKQGQEIGGRGTGIFCNEEYSGLAELRKWLEEHDERP